MEMTEEEALEAITTRAAATALIQGTPPEEVAKQFNLPLERVGALLDELTPLESSRTRFKALQAARNEVQEALLMRRLTSTPDDDAAHGLRLKAAARQSALLGLDAPARVQEQHDIKVEISWLKPGRLSYKDAEVVDVVPAEATPITQTAWKAPDPVQVARNEVDRLVAAREGGDGGT